MTARKSHTHKAPVRDGTLAAAPLSDAVVGASQIADVLEGRARYAVICADNAEVLPLLGDKSVAHVITDPPYEAEAHTLQRRVARAPYGERANRSAVVEPLSFLPITEMERTAVGAQIARLAARWMVVFCQVEAAQRWAHSLEAGGVDYLRTGVWVKPDGQPQLSGDRPGMGYESIVFAHPPGRKRWNGGGKTAVFTHARDQRFGGQPASEHPTTKPVPLMLELVELFTDPDEVVLDPFAGSGTTGVACLRLGRRVILIERDEKYAAIARERLEAESKGLTLRDARAGQLSLLHDTGPSKKPPAPEAMHGASDGDGGTDFPEVNSLGEVVE
jgi:site-specific DNA-methyltransferase (adenine-specific)